MSEAFSRQSSGALYDSVSGFDAMLQRQLAARHADDLYREPRTIPEGSISFCDNDYLGLAEDERLRIAAASHAAGAGASRLVGGNHALYDTLEQKLARLKGTEAALVFTSGFSMNQSLIPALAQKDDLILADRLCHASLLDGARASGAAFRRFAHNDVTALTRLLREHRSQYRHAFILTETIFSMDGDAAPIGELLAMAEAFDCQLLADDAHGFGLRKLTPHPRLIQLGTLSKAAGCLGGYVCGSQLLRDYLINHCRGLIYTTALPPMLLAAACEALEIMKNEPQRGNQAHAHAARFCEALGLSAPAAAIVPLILGEEQKALDASAALQRKGFYVVAIRPPTVPAGTARLRFTFSARHTEQQVMALIEAVRGVLA